MRRLLKIYYYNLTARSIEVDESDVIITVEDLINQQIQDIASTNEILQARRTSLMLQNIRYFWKDFNGGKHDRLHF